MQCDMCGTKGKLFCTEVEGTKLDLCKNCSAFGKIQFAKKPEEKKVEKRKTVIENVPEIEIIEIIVEDYAERIKKAREKLGLKQVEFAKRISEKESLLQALETAKMEPSMDLARKLERFLKIVLIEKHEEKPNASVKNASATDEAFTLGDFVKIKKR